MILSAPIPVLKTRAKAMAKTANISHLQALDQIAIQEGFASWSLLSARRAKPQGRIYDQLVAGDLVVLAARPQQGKTLMGLKIIVDAINDNRLGIFFTLEYTVDEVHDRLQKVGVSIDDIRHGFQVDVSDQIDADYITRQLTDVSQGTVVIVDYLQLLDQRRNTPDLTTQVQHLRDYACENGLIIVLLSQISRDYDSAVKSCPGWDDIRQPNPLDVGLFTKACFLHEGQVKVVTPSMR